MITNPLQALADHHEIQAPTNRGGALRHHRRQISLQAVIQRIDLVIARYQEAGLHRITLHKGVQGFLQHWNGERRHFRHISSLLQLRLLTQLHYPPRDCRRLVTDPFQVARNFHRHGDEAKFDRPRTLL